MRGLGLILLVSGLCVGGDPAQAADFIVRPTTPHQCTDLVQRLAPGRIWQGHFWGRKELDFGFIRYKDSHQTLCFASEKDCRNWLYNQQSEYRDRVWSATCMKGLSK